ncbi:MAG TPA: PAS domain-containing protein [Candidatus Dormibacteraeota bacterium]|nr:PAS domain-containing protein [Candidatus Dormibacteraeota bacterium]
MTGKRHWLGARPGAWVTWAGLAATLLLSVVDYFAFPQISFSIFYLLPVMAVAWFRAKWPSLLIALVAAVTWTLAGRGSGPNNPSVPATVFNLAAHAGVLAIVAMLLSSMRDLIDRSENRVAQRTAELESQVQHRSKIEEELRRSEERFRQLAENIREVFWMTDVAKSIMIYISPGYEAIWGRDCEGLYKSPASWMQAIEPEDRPRIMKAALKQASGNYDEQYRIIRPDGTHRWIRDRAFPVFDAEGNVYRIAGIAEDITAQRHLQKQLLEISDREQARMGEDVHDGLCQVLVSTAFDCGALEQRLAGANRPEAAQARKLGELLDSAITQARQLSRGLFPVQLEADGLVSALQELAATVTERTKIKCTVKTSGHINIQENAVATHLYRVAQEAMNNAARHGRPSEICVRLTASAEKLELHVVDDGHGFELPAGSDGLGLHIMKYRMGLIRGGFEIREGAGGGTTVACSVPLEVVAREASDEEA